MPELGRRVSVNKSTIQRYEADGVDPKRTMVINGLAQALLTTPEWLTGLSDEKEYSNYTVCQMSLEKHVKAYLETVTSAVDGEPRQEMLTTFLGQIIDLYAILTKYFALSMEKVNQVAVDEGLKESIRKYAINIGSITEQVYQKEMQTPVDDIKKYLDGILHLYDEGRTKTSMPELLGMVEQAEQKLLDKQNSVAPCAQHISQRRLPRIERRKHINGKRLCKKER